MSRRRALTLGRLVDQHIAWRGLQLGARPRGAATYRWTLDKMLQVLGADTDPTTLDHGDALDVIASWHRCQPNTIAGRVSVLRSFGAWLEDEHGLPNPFDRLRRPRKTDPVRERPTAAQVGRMLAATHDEERLIVWTLAMTGLRVSELRALRWRDVDLDASVLYVRDGKGGKGRAIPIPAPLRSLIADERARLTEHDDAEGYMVSKTRGRAPVSSTWAYKVVRRVATRAGIPDALVVGPHDLRRAYADTFLAANRGELLSLQFILGHSRIETTRLYLEGAKLADAQAAVGRIEFVTPPADEIVTPVRFPGASAGFAGKSGRAESNRHSPDESATEPRESDAERRS